MGKVGRLLSVYGVKLHMLCATNRVPISYEPTAANTAEVHLTKGLLEEAKLGEEVAPASSRRIWPTAVRTSRRIWPSRGSRW